MILFVGSPGFPSPFCFACSNEEKGIGPSHLTLL